MSTMDKRAQDENTTSAMPMTTSPEDMPSTDVAPAASQTSGTKVAARKFPPTIVYIAMLTWIGAVVAISYIADVKTAAYALAVSLLAIAGLRLTLPDGAIPRIRSRAHDAGTSVLLAVLLLALARWGNAPPV